MQPADVCLALYDWPGDQEGQCPLAAGKRYRIVQDPQALLAAGWIVLAPQPREGRDGNDSEDEEEEEGGLAPRNYVQLSEEYVEGMVSAASDAIDEAHEEPEDEEEEGSESGDGQDAESERRESDEHDGSEYSEYSEDDDGDDSDQEEDNQEEEDAEAEGQDRLGEGPEGRPLHQAVLITRSSTGSLHSVQVRKAQPHMTSDLVALTG